MDKYIIDLERINKQKLDEKDAEILKLKENIEKLKLKYENNTTTKSRPRSLSHDEIIESLRNIAC